VGPQIWAAVSMPLFKILCTKAFLATVICAISLQQQIMGGFAFMDNMDLIVTDSTNEKQVVTTKMQGSLKLWHGLLKATRGNLVPEKCFWYLIDFKYEGNHWKYNSWQADQHKIHIPRDDGTLVTIPCLDTNKAWWTLGVRLARMETIMRNTSIYKELWLYGKTI